ncbi:MAG: glycosyltransferase family 4 protein [Thermoleophilia bacterium]|nr:glycosyltransferase family 4 protein [Actinomycetota bacterium]MCL6093822.1 glycosyltransferase family 4 protein [Actinomycetota bacterium]MDA8167758.1 glycosyltransferase family 1 protein [Actinomycetota bacterium]
MRVGFDARMISWRGVGTYSRNMLKQFAQVPDLEVVCFYNDGTSDRIPSGENFVKVALNEEVFTTRNLTKIGHAVKKAGCQLFHTPYVVAPGNLDCPLLVTAHDIIPLLFPKSIPSFWLRRTYKGLLADAVGKADHIITVSTVSQSYLLAHFNLPLGKVSVILDGVGHEFGPRSDQETAAVCAKYGIGRPHILWLGEYIAHKNVTALVSAYSALSPKIRAHYKLVLAGEKSGDWQEVHKEAVRRGVGDLVNFTGFIEEPDLPALYTAADLFCFPSLYEGFGLPPLEAMACGTPVVCSNSSSLPEVVGDGGLLVAPRSAALSAAITEVLTNDNLRQRLRKRGMARASMFSWDTAAAKTLDLYRELAQQ